MAETQVDEADPKLLGHRCNGLGFSYAGRPPNHDGAEDFSFDESGQVVAELCGIHF